VARHSTRFRPGRSRSHMQSQSQNQSRRLSPAERTLLGTLQATATIAKTNTSPDKAKGQGCEWLRRYCNFLALRHHLDLCV
jgi:hypothetical protein